MMMLIKKLNICVVVLTLASLFFVACSGDDDSTTVIRVYNDTSIVTIDSLSIPDSIFESDSLLTWYLEQLAKDSPTNSYTESSDSKEDSESNDEEKPSSNKSEKSDSSSSEEKEDAEEPYDLSPVLLPPGGFYSSLTIPVPAPQNKNAEIECWVTESTTGSSTTSSYDYNERGKFTFKKYLIFEDNKPYILSKNVSITCEEFSGDEVLRKSTQTYFIGENVKMPVVAITVEPEFFSKTYVYDEDCEGGDPYRVCCHGIMDENEYPVHVEFFEKGSLSAKKDWEIDAGISLMGNYSRTYHKKPVAIKMKKAYQEGSLKYPLFDVRSEKKKFKGFNLRNGGNRYVGDYVGDPALTSLVEGSSVDYQRNRPVVVFYNGQYLGIHDMRERLNEHFVETNYKNIDSKEVDFIKHVKSEVTASGGTVDAYNAMLDFVATSDFTGENNKNYEKVQTMMDVGNFADYLAAQIYIRNGDWPNNNVRAWRSPDQPFKFILFDVDHGFGWEWVTTDFRRNGDNMLAWMRYDKGENLASQGYFINLYNQLIQNPDFRRLFINHSAVMLSEYLTYERLESSIKKINAQIPESEMERDLNSLIRRWSPYGDGVRDFDRTGSYLLEYGLTRNAVVRNDYRKEFDLGDDISVTIVANGNGKVRLDGMKLPSTNFTGKFFEGNDMLLTAVPKDGAAFSGWSDGSSENPRMFSPKDGDEIIAIFK